MKTKLAAWAMVMGGLLALQAASAGVIANSVSEFSDTQGAENWSYRLWYAPMGWSHDMPVWESNSWWEGSGRIWNAGMHPHSTDWYVVREWTSTVTGTVHITGDAELYSDQAAGVILNVFSGYDAAASVWSAKLAATQSTTLDLTLNVTTGQKILFTIIGDGAISNDNTGWSVQIATVPEPVTFGVLGLGLLGVLACRRGQSILH